VLGVLVIRVDVQRRLDAVRLEHDQARLADHDFFLNLESETHRAHHLRHGAPDQVAGVFDATRSV
jgi:hypothetical protein